MQKYTVGFIFDENLDKVLLIEKQRPAWQKGKLNGIGGKMEPEENSLDCIAREVLEESGLDIKKDKWVHLGDMSGENWLVDVYATIYKGKPADAYTAKDEEVNWFEVNNLPADTLNNIPCWFA